MKAVISRTGSVPILQSIVPASPRSSLSVTGLFSGERSNVTSPRISLHLDLNPRGIRRSLSESDMIRSESEVSKGFMRSRGVGSLSFPARIQEEEYVSESDEVGVGGIGSMGLKEKSCDRKDYGEEFDFFGGGFGKGKMSGGGGGGGYGSGGFRGGNADRSEIGAYYLEMLKSDPTSSLLLRNYGKYLHEVEGDTVKAEEYYGRAILASPGDGEVLSLYGKLIWETNRDEERARSYFDQAVNASPDDCMVLGSYAQFMWEAEEDEDDEEEEMKIEMPGAMVEAF
ncbi:hypothetical protein LguiB_034413 [Lonicera macranthoides]